MDADHSIPTTSVQQPHGTGTVDHSFEADSILPGTAPPVLGNRYHVGALHRYGGLGRVWVARDTTLGRDVALKDLRPERAANAQLRARFVEEARITGQLEHPYIVPVYDLIDGPDGPCYTMRFVAGRTLAEAAREYHDRRTAGRATRLDLAGLLDAFVAVCRAVAFAHSRGVLHRDLKGQNVVLGDYGEVFVLDWGLAKLTAGPGVLSAAAPGGLSAGSPAIVTPSPVGSRDETMSGSILGTPAFLAPEQAGGGQASMASDIYGLGGVLYVVLTGGPPYDGPTMQDVLDKILASSPPAPRTVNPACPPALEAICHKAMAREPAARYPWAEAVAADVRRWLADEPVEAFREPWPSRAARWARRHRPLVVGAAAVLLMAVVGFAVSTALVWQEERRTAAAKALADQSRARAENHLTLSQGLSDNLLTLSEKHLAPLQNSEEPRLAFLADALRTYRLALAGRPEDPNMQEGTARLARYVANLCRNMGKTSQAEECYTESVRLYEGLLAAQPVDARVQNLLAETLRDQAALFAQLGRLGDAAATGRRAIGLADTLPDKYRLTVATALLDLAGVESSLGDSQGAEKSAGRAGQLFQAIRDAPAGGAHPLIPLLLAQSTNARAVALRELGRDGEAADCHEDAVQQCRALAAANGDATRRHFYARAVVERGYTHERTPADRDAAEQDFTTGIAVWEKLRGEFPKTPYYREWLAIGYTGRGRVKTATGRLDEAATDLEKAKGLIDELTAANPDIAVYHAQGGRAFLAYGRLAAARKDGPGAAEYLSKSVIAFSTACDKAPENTQYRREFAASKAEYARLTAGRP